MFMQGLTLLILGPLIGWLRDHTASYAITFNWLNVIMVLCAIPWTIEIIIIKIRNKSI